MTFLQALEQFRGTKKYEQLKGLEEENTKLIEKFIEEGRDEKYINKYKKILNNFEKYYRTKKTKKSKDEK